MKWRGISMMKDVILFYSNPHACFNTGENESLKEKVTILKRSYLFCLGAGVLIGLVIMAVESFLQSKYGISVYENLRRNGNEFRTNRSRAGNFILACLIAPFIEECTFRLPLLIKSTFLRWIILLVFILYFVVDIFKSDVYIWWYYAVLVIIFGGIIIFISSDPSPILVRKKYNHLCWTLTVSFALLHVVNFYPLNITIFYLYPLYVLPQFVHGAVQSYLAIKYNSIVWPFLLHAGINSTAELSRLITDSI
ncbi:MAG TPA: hypothetical protein VGN64_01170 [Dyadobacter sp.]|jgi:hypothetical protein|nr:hypothetical protein [Dyadobacter sp.]